MISQKVKISELQLGDVITTHDFPYNFMTVVKISPDEIETVRPYVHTAAYSTSDSIRGNPALGIIDYIGTERMILSRQYSFDVTLVQRPRKPIL